MRFSRDSLVRAATAVSESAWLFAVLSVVSLAIGLEDSALNWLSVLAILGLSMIVARFARGRFAGTRVANLSRAGVWAVVVYAVVGAHFGLGSAGVDLGWIFRLASESAPDDLTLRLLAGTFTAVLLLWWGSRMAEAGDPVGSLMFRFRIGLVALAPAMVIDVFHPAELDTLPMSFIFFAAALGGLTVGHLMPESRESARSGTWPRLIAAMVSGVVLIGLVAALFHGGLQSLLTGSLTSVLEGALFVIAAPLFFLLEQFVNLVTGFFGRDSEEFLAQGAPFPLVDPATTTQLFLDTLQSITTTSDVVDPERDDETFEVVTQIAIFLSGVLVLAVLLLLLTITFRRFSSAWGRRSSRGAPEAIDEGVNLAADIGDLLRKLIPDWRLGGRKKAGFRLPDGPPGAVTVLRMYYDLLTLAKEKGYPRPPNATPGEFQGTLERIFPVSLVRMATAAFNRACYGYHPATEEEIGQMQSAFASIRTTAGPASGRRPGFGASPPQDAG